MIRVVVVDDQTLVRQGIRGLLALTDAVDVVAEGADGDDALALVAEHRPDVLLLDLQMPRRDGIAVLEALRAADDPTPVLVLTTFDDDALVARALGGGARGYLLKDVTLDQLVDAVRRVAAGERLWQPAVSDRLLRALLDRPALLDGAGVEGADRPEPLTARELDVLRLLAAGWSNREIAETLHLASGTVKNHVSAVLLKLGVRDRTRAVLRALDLGLLGR
ncbi:response regulator [Cellulomonas wangsupingiae]|uniref:Response regulator transcription factor n=1 Tax=Cellulomonas wangsupingiae TaxID=2968085 RepID=A0ABY5K6E1_9CELL|nr:response regulator transcription factor [Cellulomonas wangsupingiae]MCC2334115.1 response regulator transcription factor [Cellulomonas wangsupingiae]MCM0638729.1 response regulator transcription factor [Cellulomonas wangsupingiae]UUI65358.1 response regulator transcription factor [Cellulomonas wangsupingiae]